MEIKQIEQLVDSLRILPGVGEKTARKYAFDLIESEEPEIDQLISSLNAVKELQRCETCHGYAQTTKCELCQDETRSKDQVVVTAFPREILKIESIIPNTYRFFTLGGVIDPLNGVNSNDLAIADLRNYVVENGVSNVTLILPVTNEGEITASYIKRNLSDLNVTFSKLAQGVPIGASLEYLDEITLLKSIQSASPY